MPARLKGPLKEVEAGLHLNSEEGEEPTLPSPVATVSVGSSRIFYESVGFWAIGWSVIRLDEVADERLGFGELWFVRMVCKLADIS